MGCSQRKKEHGKDTTSCPFMRHVGLLRWVTEPKNTHWFGQKAFRTALNSEILPTEILPTQSLFLPIYRCQTYIVIGRAFCFLFLFLSVQVPSLYPSKIFPQYICYTSKPICLLLRGSNLIQLPKSLLVPYTLPHSLMALTPDL